MTDLAVRGTAVNATRRRAIEELRRMVLAAPGEHDAEVWLFGSCARGDAFQHSDIDIANLVDEGRSRTTQVDDIDIVRD